jgi:hypothetical protein
MRACKVCSVFILPKLEQQLAKMDIALQKVPDSDFDPVYGAWPLKVVI